MLKINIKKKEKLARRVFTPTQKDIEDYNSMEAFCSANFNVFLPGLPYTEHTQRFREVLFNQYYAFIERGDLDLVDALDLSGLNLIKDSGFILCSFHYGAYKLLSATLIRSNRKFFVVINNSVSPEIKNDNHKFFKKGKKRYHYTAQEQFLHLNVESPDFIFRCKDLINEGYIMLIFLDGNSGLDGIMKTNGRNMYGISFLNNEIFVKKGLTALSHAYKTPILPVFALRTQRDGIIKIESQEPIYPDLSLPREVYSKEVTQKLYNILEKKVLENPFEWEGWLYLHKWLNIEKLNTPPDENNVASCADSKKIEELAFNKQTYIPFRVSGKNFLLDKFTHLSYEISSETRQIIDGNRSLLNEENIGFFKVNRILI